MQEVCFRNEEVKTLTVGDFEYRLYWKAEDTTSRVAGLTVKCELAKLVINVKRISSKILSVNLVLCGKVVTVITVYPRVVQVKKIKTVLMRI